MVFSWLRDRRKELLAEPFPAAWREYLTANVRHYAHLEPAGQERVHAVVRVLAAEKHWEGGGGFAVSDEMRVTVAAQASLLVLGLDEPYYFDRVQSIILYPNIYIHPPQFRQYRNAPSATRLLGEAWYHSPIVLSWKHVLQAGRNQSNGGNVVLHEFAHYLDGLDGQFDGAPPLAGREREKTWYRVTEAAYRRLVGAARRHEVTLLNHYGATNRAEFFAVATECFFERPHAMRQQHADLYAVLSDFYCQDPARCWPDAAISTTRISQPTAEELRDADAAALACNDADRLFTLAVTCINEGRYALAEKAASRAIELNPSDGEAYQYRAAARVGLRQCMAALNDCNRAMELDECDGDFYRVRGAAYVGLQQYELAKHDLDRALGENRNDAEAYRLRGSALLGMNQIERALSDYSASIAVNPLSPEAYLDRGLAFRKLGRSAEADADLEKASQLDPEVGRRR